MRWIDYYDAQGWGAQAPTALLPRQLAARRIVAGVLVGRRGLGARVVDIGCGDGFFLDRLAATVADPSVSYVGVDLSDHQLGKAARLPYEFHKGDLDEGIPLPDRSVDVVHGAEVIEHVYNPDLLVEECARVLRPGGHLILTTPNLQAWYNRVLFLAGIQPLFLEPSSRSTEVGAGALRRFKRSTTPVGHLRLFNRRALTDLLRREGFRVVAVRGARYHDMPAAGRWLDALLCARPSLASILVAHAVLASD